MLATVIGLLAAALTSLSYVPQVKKALPAASTEDLTLAILAVGLSLWVAYGMLQSDYVIVVANAVGFALVTTLIGFKIRDAH